MDIIPTGKTVITLEELAIPFSKHIWQHLITASKQTISNSSSSLYTWYTCQRYNKKEISEDQLIQTTVKLRFNNIIDAFHIVNGDEIPIKFYEKEYANKGKNILTDNVFKL